MKHRIPLFSLIALLSLLAAGCGERIDDGHDLTPGAVRGAERVLGLELTAAERELLLPDLVEQRDAYRELRSLDLANAERPALVFSPLLPGMKLARPDRAPRWSDPGPVHRPADLDSLAFATVAELSALIHAGLVSSRELTELCLERLERYDPRLHCVVTLTPGIARRQAARADSLLAAGVDLGPLHGIPYGVKDLLAVRGTVTTWGAAPYRDQVIDDTATVVRRLEAAGAVLCAKLTLGALAMGDVWFGGKTRNPWRPEQGSSGSSAGPASAVAAGLLPFAIGSETWGSIVSPSVRCGVTGLRPTFGRVSRSGAMALSWTMDKLGPIARSVEDCVMVLDAIRGPDGEDPTVVDAPLPYDPRVDWSRLRIGYLEQDFALEDSVGRALDEAALDVLRGLGARLVPVPLPEMDAYPLSIVLAVEAAAAFEELTLSGRDDLLVRQGRGAWPNIFRAARFVPAVEYVQANRARVRLMRAMDDLLHEVDLYVAPAFAGQNLLVTNLTGHPCVVVPDGFTGPDQPHGITFVGRLYDEATVAAVARAYQEASGFHRRHPEGYLGGLASPPSTP